MPEETKIQNPPEHSDLAPSAAKRWTRCTASVGYIATNRDRIPPDTGSEYADEGTLAHEWAAKILNGLADISDLPGDMQEPVGEYVAFCERLAQPGDKVFTEKSVPLYYKPEHNGTVDRALVGEKRLYIIDFKYGKGVIVEAKENEQLAIYTRSLIDDLEESGLYEFPDEMLCTMAVFQPRAFDEDCPKLWAVSVGELKKFTDEIGNTAKIIEAAQSGSPEGQGALEFDPQDGWGGTCFFCPAKGFCGARKELMQTPLPFDVTGVLDNVDEAEGESSNPVPGVKGLTPKQIAQIVLNKKAIESWLGDVKEYAENAISSGIPIPGLKLVAGKQGNRGWTDEEAAGKLIAKYIPASDRFKPKVLISPTQAEKKLKPFEEEFSTRFKNRLAELVTRKAGGKTLVPESDPRESIVQPAVDVFVNEEEEDPLA